MIYFYRAYGLTLCSDTAISALRVEPIDCKLPDIAMSFGPEPEWVRDALSLSQRIDCPRAGEAEGDDSPFTLTVFGEEEFFQLAYDDGTPRIEDSGMCDALLELVQNTYMNRFLDRNQRAAELDVLSRLVANVPVRKIVPHADPSRIGTLCELILRDAECLSGRQSSAAVESGR